MGSDTPSEPMSCSSAGIELPAPRTSPAGMVAKHFCLHYMTGLRSCYGSSVHIPDCCAQQEFKSYTSTLD